MKSIYCMYIKKQVSYILEKEEGKIKEKSQLDCNKITIWEEGWLSIKTAQKIISKLCQKKAKQADLKAKQTDLLSANDSNFLQVCSDHSNKVMLFCNILQAIKDFWGE